MSTPAPKAYAPFYAIKKVLFFFLLLITSATYAQQKVWTWMNGSNTAGSLGTYGTTGVADAANIPRSRSYHGTCKDADGNIWIYAGHDFGVCLNDLWKYTVSTGLWTLMSGDSLAYALPDYGTMGIPGATNKPGARSGTSLWYAGGYIYVFGGGQNSVGASTNFDNVNDLWRFNISTREWTWINGTTTKMAPGIYGTKGIPAATNTPGARDGAAYWSDANGNLWLFGGLGYAASGTAGMLNDLWKYNIATNTWTWMSGDSSKNATGLYGTKGISAAANKPISRRFARGWVDAAGNGWLFSGGNGGTGNVPLNDLWKYDVTTNEWTWLSGDSTYSAPGVYGTKGVPDAANTPGARHGSGIAVDVNNTVWVFGGVGYDANGVNGYINDLWTYDMTSGLWTWQSGSSTRNGAANYGTKGVPDVNNMPGGRYFSTAWTDGAGNFWLFAGSLSTSYYNDLWRYNTLQPLPIQHIALLGTRHNNNNVLTWQTITEANTQQFMIERSEDGIAYTVLGTVAATGSGNNQYTYTDAVFTGKTYYYRLQVVDRDAQSYYSPVVIINAATSFRIKTYPNPASKGITIEMSDGSLLNTTASIYTAAGQLAGIVHITSLKQYINLQQYAKGVFSICFSNGKTVTVVKE